MSFPPFTAIAPATTANLGPGFDCLGAALTLANRFRFSPADTLAIRAAGPEAGRVPTDRSNLLYRAFEKLFRHLDRPVPAVAIDIELGVPLARGLGSSATAIVGGLLAANHLAGSPLDTAALARLAIAIEGHPDNVVPCLRGGAVLSARTDDTWLDCDLPWHDTVVPIVAIPDFELSTAQARSVLPATVDRADAIHNIACLGLLLRGLATGCGPWIAAGSRDRLHQPYRFELIPGWQQVRAAALDAGAWSVAISGAGPTLLALAPRDRAATVAPAMAAAWQETGIAAAARVLALDPAGARIAT